jgi:chemotaxis response regulator CheB
VSSDQSEHKPGSPFAEDDPVRQAGKPVEGASFPIVGIGASAGGLEAFTELLRHLPPDTGMGFVLVQHLDPQHESALTQLLARATSLPVREVTDNLRVQSNHVYVIPPNTNLAIAQGVLKLQPRQQTRTPQRSVDFFFESLAEDQRERSIGVILSGTATDGTLGLEAIKAEGGITFAQDDSARYDSMPRSAVAAGCVDFVLSPENIAKGLARIAKHPYVASGEGRGARRKSPAAMLSPLFTRHWPLATRHFSRTASRKFFFYSATIPASIFRSTNPPPFSGALPGAWC